MKTFISKKILPVVLLVMTAVMTGCNYTDSVSAYDGIDLEKLLSTTYEFTGFVFDNLGKVIPNARLTAYKDVDGLYTAVSKDATTENGVYKLSVDKKDDITDIKIKVEASGYYSDSVKYDLPMEDRLVAHDFHLFVNPDSALSPTTRRDYLISDSMAVDDNGYFTGYLTTQTVKGDNPRANIKVELQLACNGKDEVGKLIDGQFETGQRALISMTAMYTQSQVRTYENMYKDEVPQVIDAIANGDSVMLCGVYLASNAKKGGKLISTQGTYAKNLITFHVDAELKNNNYIPMKFRNGKWHKMDRGVELTDIDMANALDYDTYGIYNGNVIIRPDDFGAYALFVEVSMDEQKALNPDSIHIRWDNRETFPKYIDEAQYLYNFGVKYDRAAGGTIGQALLLERLYRTYGYNFESRVGTYKMDHYCLRPGWSVVLKGTQDFYQTIFSAEPCGSITKTSYGGIGFIVVGYTVDHNGGNF